MTRINTNVTSMLAGRVLNNQQTAMQTSLKRLSTGLRINSGADDPAGLIASEILRGSKASLSAAIANGERASNVVGTAEGALNEVSNLLTQLQDLVTTSANKGAQSTDEIAANQLQVDSILNTINSIANSTNFEGVKLLTGSLNYTTSSVTAGKFDDITLKSVNLIDGKTKTVVVQVTTSAQTAKLAGSSVASNITLQVTGKYGTQTFSFANGTTTTQMRDTIVAARDVTGVSAALSGNKLKMVSTEYGTDSFVTVKELDKYNWGGNGTAKGVDAVVMVNGQQTTAEGLSVSVTTSDFSADLSLNSTFGTTKSTQTFYVTGGGANFALAGDVLTGKSSVGIQSVATTTLGDTIDGFLNTLGGGQTNSLSSNNLGKAQRIINTAITQVANMRGRLGAFQSLTINSAVSSMSVALENTSAAESAIRDTDFASETASMTRSQILVQAATSVLKQANMAPQNVLALLQ